MAKIPANECKAPYFAYQHEGQWRIKRGSCNRWECERCQHSVASQHYARIVKGAEILSLEEEENLWFLTVTCRGKEMKLEEAMENYGTWTNHLLTCLRKDAKKSKQSWHYVQVTELQQRGHPHSHILTTYKPKDAVKNPDDEKKYISEWFRQQCINAGLGNQYDISLVRDPKAASRYVAKYMFKETQFTTEFPAKWKRVRYSAKWPKLPEYDTDAMALVKHEDWLNLATLAVSVTPDKESVSETVYRLQNLGVLIRLPKENS